MIDDKDMLLQHAADIITAHVSHNEVPAADLPDLIRGTYAALADLGAPASMPVEDHVAAVSARKSLVSPDHIISMIDGKPYRTLRRHLGTHGLTPEQYRARYKLPADYPMVAKSYSEQRRAMSLAIELGRKRAERPAEMSGASMSAEVSPARRRGRSPKAEAATDHVAVPKSRARKLSGAEALAQVRAQNVGTSPASEPHDRTAGTLSPRFSGELASD